MKNILLIVLIIVAVMVTGCSTSDSAGDKSPLTGTEWQLFEMDGVKYEPVSGKSVTMKLDSKEKNINGKAPCNTYGGPYIKSSNKLSFGGLYSTEMACDELDKETSYFALMQKVFAYQISGDKLYLFDSTGMVILRFKAK